VGLDLVDLVLEVEDTFGIRFTNAEAEKWTRVGELIRGVYGKLHPPAGSWYCESGRAFYKFRKAMRQALPLERHQVRPGSSLELLLPIEHRPETWRRLQAAGLDLPTLILPYRLFVACLALVGGFVALHLIALPLGVPEATVGWFLVGTIPIISLLVYYITRPFADQLPERVRTVRGVVRILAKREFALTDYDERRQLEHFKTWKGRSHEEVARKVREVIAEVLGVDVEQIEQAGDGARFIEDLGAG
jgi:acyl carrier protein